MNKAWINHYCRKLGFEIHGTGYIQSVKKSSFKDDAFEKQKELVRNTSPVIFDIGANRGDVSQKYIDLFPNATIYAFEPFQEVYKVLKDRFQSNTSIHCYNKGISDTVEQREFYVNKNADTNSILKPKKTGLSSDKQVENQRIIQIESETLDHFSNEIKLDQIDILKMDIQGGELSALNGAQNLLKKGAIRCIYSEVYFIEQYESQPLFHEISKFLYEYGFVLQDIYTPIYGKGNIAWGDAVFVLKDI